MSVDANLLRIFRPLVLFWGTILQWTIPYRGRTLEPWEEAIARKVGVTHSDQIRLITVRDLPFPKLPGLRRLAGRHGMSRDGGRGLTLGHGIFIKEGCYSVRLLSHECRHVYQYEQAGSIGKLLTRYLEEVLEHGYSNAPLEHDARNHEISNVMRGRKVSSQTG
jgi:hypothetical protein